MRDFWRFLGAKVKRKLENGQKVDLRIIGRSDYRVGMGVLHQMFKEAASGELSVQEVYIRQSKIKKILSPRIQPARMAIYADVLENWKNDISYKKVRNADIKIAYLVYDSSSLPESWVKILNSEFDLVLTPSEFVKTVVANSGCKLPIFVFPLKLPNLHTLQPVRFSPASRLPIRFLSIASYHPRKNHRKLIRAFLEEFGPHETAVQLNIHSNLAFGHEYELAKRQVEIANAKNIFLSHGELHPETISEIFDYSEVYVAVSKGEGFCIPAREAAIRGKIVIVTAGSALNEVKADRLIKVPIAKQVPGFYPELEESCHGLQGDVSISGIRKALRKAQTVAISIRGKSNLHKVADEQFSEQAKLSFRLRSFFRPIEIVTGKTNEIEIGKVTVESTKIANLLQRTSILERKIKKRVIVGHDGGFFSLFNIYLSHLVWGQGANGIKYVLPDWRVDSIQKFHGIKKFQSFCYGKRTDDNIWARLFQSPYADISERVLDNPKTLYEGSVGPEHSWNEENEPNLTYIHAGKLYKSPDFQQWRRWYNAYYKRYILLKPHIATQIDRLEKQLFGNAYIISAHIRHPSHAIEQPNGRMPEVDNFLYAMEKEIASQRGRRPVKIFVATDQEKVIKQVSAHFGSMAVFVKDAVRLTEQQDKRFQEASSKGKLKEGFQLQHLAAAAESKWSIKMAEEVIIDTILLARTHSFFHTVSNIATAVAYMNPSIKMNYLEF